MAWWDVISVEESERLCRLWHSQGHTSAAALRALLEERAALLRTCVAVWERAMGRQVA